MLRLPTLGDENRTGSGGFLRFAGMLIEFSTGKGRYRHSCHLHKVVVDTLLHLFWRSKLRKETRQA
jgi:hypothetical protein